ncbi:MAG: DUF86 domain-containing protein [Ignavibacteria bacterium]|nr:DUF86 domain-containing protein [Ignavibacteria bacterium]
MLHSDRTRIQHMIDAAKEAVSFAVGKTRSDLDNDRMLVLSVIKEIEIIGEAASKISKEMFEEYPDIPWTDIVGMRNHLVHGYFEVDLDLVWNTLQEDLPLLINLLSELIKR